MDKEKTFAKINKLLKQGNQSQRDNDFISTTIPKKFLYKKPIKRAKKVHREVTKSTPKPKLLLINYIRVLVTLKVKGKCTINYNYNDFKRFANNKQRFSIFRTLFDLNFIKVTNKESNYISFKLTKIGNEYVQKYLPKFRDIYKMTRVFRVTKWIVNITVASIIILGALIIVCIIIPPRNYMFSKYWFTMVISIGLSFLIFVIGAFIDAIEGTRRNNLPKRLYKHRLINKATQSNFIKFLKKKHIKEINVRFDYNLHYSKIHTIMFHKNEF